MNSNQNMNNGYGQAQNNVPNQNMNNGYGQSNSFNPNYNDTTPKKKNTKLIIIIAVIVGLLAIICGRFIFALIATSSVSDYLDDSRKGAFSDKALSAVTMVKNEMIIYDINGKQCYSLAKLTEMSELPFGMSPTGKNYDSSSYVLMEKDSMGNYTGGICLVDEEGVGISYTSEENISKDSVTTGVTCTLPPECN